MAYTEQSKLAPNADVEDSDEVRVVERHPFNKHFLQLQPLLGMLALLITAASVLFTLAILVVSNNKPKTWTLQPSVYLSIASALANSAVGFAYAQAAVIAWWYRASSKGSSIRALERQYEASSSLWTAIFPSKDTKLAIRVATILVALMVIDGPLLQKASTISLATQSEMVTLNFTLAPEIPHGFAGFVQDSNDNQSFATAAIAEDWINKAPITLPTTCKGTCVGKIIGPGVVESDCSVKTWSINADDWFDPDAVWGNHTADEYYTDNSIGNRTNPLFYVKMQRAVWLQSDDYGSEAAYLNVGLIRYDSYTRRQCWLRPALLEYDVTFDNTSVVTIRYNGDSTGRTMALANNTLAYTNSTSAPTTIGVLAGYLGRYWHANAAYQFADSGRPQWLRFSPSDNSMSMRYTSYAYGEQTAITDPTVDIIRDFNGVLFRAAVYASTWSNLTQLIDPGLSPAQSIAANETITQNVRKI